jgi:DNA-directed RNA polymerase specialized sigma24 family protein
MGSEETFDAFYRTTRTSVLHQAFALTGDLPAAQAAVRDAYVAAWHHWRKVSRLDDPRDWVRPHAWQLAARRHTARIWHRSKGIPEDHKRVLDALGKLSSTQRRVLLLSVLAEVPLPLAARELGLTREVTERHLEAATAAFAGALELAPSDVRRPLAALAGSVRDASLPRPSIVRRAGRKRRQLHTLGAVVAAAVVAVAAGGFAYAPTVDHATAVHLLRPQPQQGAHAGGPLGLPTAAQLLDRDQVRRLGMDQDWTVLGTDNNTSGDGINTICQQQRFADPDGLSALVRRFKASGHPSRTAIQTVEISKSTKQAEDGFRTTVGWYAGCQVARLQLLDAYRVDNIGDEATILSIKVWSKPVTTYAVAVARVGDVTTSTVVKTVGGRPTPPGQVAQSLADAVSMLCGRSGAAECAKQPTFEVVPPPPSGRLRGVLAVADLPPVGRIDKPWVATAPQVVGKNPAATTCDRADFAHGGASHVVSRTYLIPQAKLPARFGLTETYGEFPASAKAASFLSGVRTSVAGCEKRDLATKVLDAHRYAERGMDVSLYTLQTEVSNREKVRFRVGFVRLGNRVAQLNFAPGPRDDISYEQFRSMLFRAGDRLRELG